jgi:hypothetical protein
VIWLGKFVTLVQSSPSYQAGNTLIIVTNDEGYGPDATNGEVCSNQALDLTPTSAGGSDSIQTYAVCINH